MASFREAESFDSESFISIVLPIGEAQSGATQVQVVFEMIEGGEARAYVVDVVKVDESTLSGVHKGEMRSFPLGEVRNATTVSGRPFSLRPFDIHAIAGSR